MHGIGMYGIRLFVAYVAAVHLITSIFTCVNLTVHCGFHVVWACGTRAFGYLRTHTELNLESRPGQICQDKSVGRDKCVEQDQNVGRGKSVWRDTYVGWGTSWSKEPAPQGLRVDILLQTDPFWMLSK